MNKNNIIITIVSVLLIFSFLFAVYNFTSQPPQNTIYQQAKKVNAKDHIKWSPAKKNVLVEYSDLQCPACKAYHTMIKNEIETNQSGGGDIMKNITFIYRHYPLDQHKYAKDAAYAAEAAGNQGKFYEMSNLLFEGQEQWSVSQTPKDDFLKMAQKLNLDIEKYKKDVDSQEVKNKVERDYQSGIQAQVRATPTFYLNGQKLDNIRSFDEFKKLLQSTK